MKKITPGHFSVHGLRYKTNNCCESLHATMKRNLPAHPGFYCFLECLVQQIIIPAEIDILQVDAGINPKQKMSTKKLNQLATLATNEEKLATGEWTSAHLLEASCLLYKKLTKLKIDEEERVDAIDSQGLSDLEDYIDSSEDDTEEGEGQAMEIDTTEQPANQKCIVCKERPQDTVLMPCHHQCICSTCAAILQVENAPEDPACPALSCAFNFTSVIYININ
jgi:hypothetical protein